MSSCEKYQELISRMVDGDLSQKEERELSAHLKTCSDCTALYQAFSMLSQELGEDLEKAPLDLRDNVMAEIHREEIRKRNRLPNILRAVMSAAACVAVIVGVYLGVALTRGNHLSTAAFQSNDAAAEEVAAMREESAEEKAALPQMAAAGLMPAEEPAIDEETPRLFADSAAAPEAVMEAEEDAPAAETANAVEAAPAEAPVQEEAAAAADEAEEPVEEPEAETIELRGWNLSLLRTLLGGDPAEREAEELKNCLRYRILLITEEESREVSVYELDGVLYYLDPAEDTLYQADLTPEEFDLFLHG